jgi:hypothetical protein
MASPEWQDQPAKRLNEMSLHDTGETHHRLRASSPRQVRYSEHPVTRVLRKESDELGERSGRNGSVAQMKLKAPLLRTRRNINPYDREVVTKEEVKYGSYLPHRI